MNMRTLTDVEVLVGAPVHEVAEEEDTGLVQSLGRDVGHGSFVI